ncbi:dynamin-related protein 4C-like [Manihot esculenta]|uniref:dynamin-related protein 4C-like n=1 Tax=Manihot esculenta TaxID=3983 RepID=UPI001CC75596|nr:dynamin-related protein 4C-like [Manihot esculenta]
MVGIPVLAQKLSQIQATIIARCLPDIVRNIDDKLKASISELNRMPKTLASPAEAMAAFMGIVGSAKESLRKILIRGEFDEYVDDYHMHCTARLVEMLNLYSDELHKCSESDPRTNFLVEEIRVLEEAKGIELPNFLPHTAFLSILQRKVEGISRMPIHFFEKVWAYIEKIVQMEKMTDYTCSPEYMNEWNKLMGQLDTFKNRILTYGYSKAEIAGIGEVDAGNIREHQNVLHQAFDLKMKMTAYWKIVLRRLVDYMALQLQFSVQNLVNKEMEKEIVSELMSSHGGAVETMLEESPSVAAKREKLNMSIKLLGESKKVLGNIMDKIATYND